MNKILEGKIVSFNSKVMVAQIETGGMNYQANKNVLEEVGLVNPKVGDKVFFIADDKKGKQPKVLRIVNASLLEKFETVSLPTPPDRKTSQNEFSNPYSFVPVTEPLESEKSNFKKPFVAHDRFEGLSGIITCHLKTLTPFFTADSRTFPDEKDKLKHKKLDYFSLDDVGENFRIPRIAGSTLRGAIRSVCEAVTNSTFAAVSSEKLEFRCLPAEGNQLKAGIIISLPNGDGRGKIKELKIERVPFNQIPKGAKDGDKGWFYYKDKQKVFGLGEPTEANPRIGYFKLTGQNILKNDKGESQKQKERFFYEDAENSLEYEFCKDEQEKYEGLIKAQRERAERQRENKENNEVADAILKRKNYPLQIGHLVYFRAEKDKTEAFDLGYVSIPRRRYTQPVSEALNAFFHPSTDAESLCPASRLFGFVRDSKIHKSEKPKYSSYAGRVYFSDAQFVGEKVKYAENVALEILSSPKPTTTEFYLTNQTDATDVWNQDKNLERHLGYDSPKMSLRGRKFYWHQKDEGQYVWQEKIEMQAQNSQNSTVKLLGSGNEFEFTVRFENLESYELGMLLWSLVLDEGMKHKIGMGKPIGLGSVEIKVVDLRLTERQKRYESFFDKEDGTVLATGLSKQAIDDWKESHVTDFLDWINKRFGQSLDMMPNFLALSSILSYPNNDNAPIHYPLKPKTNEKSYEWFMDNRSTELIREGKSQILPYPFPIQNVQTDLIREIPEVKKKKKN